MAVLPDPDRQRISNGLQRYWSSIRELTAGFTSSDLRAAVNATDDWIDQNVTAFNNALPNPFRSNATLLQKTVLFCAVALMRVNIGFLKTLFGEVD